MLRILIAEDEIPLLRGIKRMIESINSEFEVVKCARNGKEAIEYLEKNPIDVILTDINMPMMDGIDVLEAAAKIHPKAYKIVISGYSEFKYAQQAIRYGTGEYLLKPIIKEELDKILDRIYREYKDNQLKRQKELLKGVVYESKKTTGDERLQILYFCAGPLMKEGMEESVAECGFWKDVQIEETAAGLLPKDTSIYAFEKNQPNERILLLVPKNEINLDDFVFGLVEKIKEKNICVTVACHQQMIEMQQIPIISHQLRKAVQENILFCESSIVSDEAEEWNKAYRNRKLPYTIGKDIPLGKDKIVLKEIEEFVSENAIRQKDCVDILQKLLTMLAVNTQIREETVDEIVWNLILYSQSTAQLFDSLRQMLSERGRDSEPETTEELMKKLEAYISEHVAEPITAASCAGRFGLVAPYLSRLFKEYSGYTVSQYIQKIRLDRAKRLLEMDEEILAKDVADMTGYPNPLYFSKVFKKKVGIYPSEYRKQKAEEKKLAGNDDFAGNRTY